VLWWLSTSHDTSSPAPNKLSVTDHNTTPHKKPLTRVLQCPQLSLLTRILDFLQTNKTQIHGSASSVRMLRGETNLLFGLLDYALDGFHVVFHAQQSLLITGALFVWSITLPGGHHITSHPYRHAAKRQQIRRNLKLYEQLQQILSQSDLLQCTGLSKRMQRRTKKDTRLGEAVIAQIEHFLQLRFELQDTHAEQGRRELRAAREREEGEGEVSILHTACDVVCARSLCMCQPRQIPHLHGTKGCGKALLLW
jgi:hypothetical protein